MSQPCATAGEIAAGLDRAGDILVIACEEIEVKVAPVQQIVTAEGIATFALTDVS